MSRSFVRAWATVATIMAMVCLAFVQPMPEHSSSSAPKSAKVASPAPGIKQAPSAQLSTTAPFVDSITTGKTFTPYVALAGSMLALDGASRPADLLASLEELRSSPQEPPTRPG